MAWNTLGAAFAACYLIPFKAAMATGASPAELVLPMLLAAALASALLDIGSRGLGGRLRSLFAPPSRTTLFVVVLVALASALGNEAVIRSLELLHPGIASVTLRTQVIFVALGGMFLLGERVGIRFVIGTGLALVGIVFLRGGVVVDGAGVPLAGIAWAVVGAVSFGSIQIIIRRFIRTIDKLQVNSIRLWLAALLVALIPGRLGGLADLDLHLWALVATSALAGPVASRLCLMRALETLPAAHATLGLVMAPFFAFLLAGLVLGTWPGPIELLGSLVILAAVALPVSELKRAADAAAAAPEGSG